MLSQLSTELDGYIIMYVTSQPGQLSLLSQRDGKQVPAKGQWQYSLAMITHSYIHHAAWPSIPPTLMYVVQHPLPLTQKLSNKHQWQIADGINFQILSIPSIWPSPLESLCIK